MEKDTIEKLREMLRESYEKIESLESEILTENKKKDTIRILWELGKHSKNPYTYAYGAATGTSICSKESFDEIIGLLSEDEYLTSGGARIDDSIKDRTTHEYHRYFINLDNYSIIVLSVVETRINENGETDYSSKPVETNISVEPVDLRSKLKIVRQGLYIEAEEANISFDRYYGRVSDSYLQYNGETLKSVLTPVSFNDLTNRLLTKLKDEKSSDFGSK